MDPDHDQIYLRFLFRLGDPTTDGLSLYARFEELLGEIGIRLEFDGDNQDVQDIARDEALLGEADWERDAERSSPRPQRRRASLQSLYDAEDESTRLLPPQRRSRTRRARSVDKLQDTTELRSSTKDKWSVQGFSQPGSARRRTRSVPAEQRIPDTRHVSQPQQAHQTQSRRLERGNTHVSDRKSSPNAEEAITGEHNAPIDRGDLHVEHFPQHENSKDFNLALDHRELLYAPSRTQLLRDAETFHGYRIRGVASELMRTWCDAALEARKISQQRIRIADKHDANILVRQAFEQWHLKLGERRRAMELRQYFDRLEKRAITTRNLYLLARAFSHWSQCAEEEVLKSMLARRHILSIKYFHTWKDLALGNEAKIHAFELRKSLLPWKRRLFQSFTMDIKAGIAYQRSLARRIYWQWFWTFCEQRAPEWYLRRLRETTYQKWVTAFRSNRQRKQQVTLHVERAARKFFLSQWLRETRIDVRNTRAANLLNRQRLLGYALQHWQRRSRLDPLAEQVSNMVDWRIAGTTFATIVYRFRVEKRAQELNELRLTRNIWTHWNDALRWQAFAARLNDRRLLEALYKWTLAERQMLMKRIVEQKLRQRCLAQLQTETQRREAQRQISLQLFVRRRQDSSLGRHFALWRARQDAARRAQQAASAFLHPRLTYDSLRLLNERFQQIRSLEPVALDTAFYFATKHYLHQWQSKLIESKRLKRRTAYMQIRRKRKIDMVSTILQHWKTCVTVGQSREQDAESFNSTRQLRTGTEMFDRWRNLYNLTMEQAFDAEEYYESLLLRRSFGSMRLRNQHHLELDGTAALNAEFRVQNRAFICLNRIRLKIIELKGPLASAENLRARNIKRQFHTQFRIWHAKSRLRVQDLPQTERSSAQTSKFRLRPQIGNLAKSAAPSESAALLPRTTMNRELHPVDTPFLGSLSTPSKRAARARALIQESTTPTSTPFQNRLRAQLNVTPRTTSRLLFSRAAVEPGRGRSSIEEEHNDALDQEDDGE